MNWICDCGMELELLPIEKEDGFLVSTTVCPACFQVWRLRLTKAQRIKVVTEV